ncbi:MAG TPA: L,D-transpeptidase family protein [Syntrophobacteraceae bacterium]|nr:L,D-transpeptidase family protein [Syntrophobacteraceae bacterium]
MAERTSTGFGILGIVLVSLILLPCFLNPPDLAAQETRPSQEPLSSPQGQSRVAEDTASRWRAALWEAVPAELLSDSGPGTLVDVYGQNDWKPLFFDFRFQLAPGTALFLKRLEDLESDAVNPASFPLDSLKKGLKEVEELRAALQPTPAANQDRTGANPPGAGQEASPSPPPSQASVASQPAPANGETDRLSDVERDPRYLQLLKVASETDVKLGACLIRFAQEMNPFSPELREKVLLGKMSMAEFLEAVVPNSPHYATLRKALTKYRSLAAQEPWHRFHSGKTLRQGDSGQEVSNLQKRLAQEGFYSGKISGHFDHATADAVRKFQRYHLIDADGAVGQRTKDWLNVPYNKKVRLLQESLKQLRQSRARPYDRYVRINIPQFMLEYYRDGKIQAEHRVIVGKAAGKKVKVQGRWMGENQTPSISSVIDQVVFNPRWYVSDRIRRELADEIAADPNYLDKHGYVKMSSNYPWGEPRLFQLPGPGNPLGRVKFEFSNAYAIFLHDTPKRHLFQRAKRDFSHGCIRVEKARELAQLLLADDGNSAVGKTESFLESYTRQTFVKFNQPVPIIIEYVPASSDGNGQVVFCGDLYGWFAEEGTQRS